MAEHEHLQEDEMIRRAIEALLRDLGPVEPARFLTLSRQHRLDSVTRRRLWQEGLERDSLYAQVFVAKGARSEA